MQGNVVVRTGANAEPISLLEAKLHCNIDADIVSDNALLIALIAAARAHVENATNSVMITRGFRATFPHFTHLQHSNCFGSDGVHTGGRFMHHADHPRSESMRLRGPVRRVDSVIYLDVNKISQTLESSIYDVDTSEPAGTISLSHGQNWPAVYRHPAAVNINFRSGYATPFVADATTNTLTAIGHPFVNGDVVPLYNSGGELPDGLVVKTDYFVINISGNTLQLSSASGGIAIDIADAGTGLNFLGIVPEEMRQAMLLLIGHWYERRGLADDSRMAEVPFAAEMLLAPMRVMGF